MKCFKYLFALFALVFALTVFLHPPPHIWAGDQLVSHLQETIKVGEIFHIIEELASHKYRHHLPDHAENCRKHRTHGLLQRRETGG
jgi:hypothetical protein